MVPIKLELILAWIPLAQCGYMWQKKKRECGFPEKLGIYLAGEMRSVKLQINPGKGSGQGCSE